MSATQKNRQLAVKSPLAADKLLLLRMQGHEALGRLSEYRLDLLSPDPDIDFATLLGQDMSVTLALDGGGERQFNGIVSEFSLGAGLGQTDQLIGYHAVLRPRLWLLTRGAHCRFFHGKSVLQIVLALLQDYHVDVDNQCSASYPALPHCAQYRESDFDFFSRLIEREGIYYFFRHAGGKHTLVLADSPQVHTAIPQYGQIDYKPWGDRLAEAIQQWRAGGQLQAGRFATNAYDFEAPSKSGQQGLLARAQQPKAGEFDRQDCPAPYTEVAQGERYARIAMQARQVLGQYVEAEASARGIWPGGLFRLNGHPRADQNRQYLVTAASYALHSDAFGTELNGGGSLPVFSCSLTAIGHDVGFRSQALTARPMLMGPQTAMVVGPDGDEIHTDQYGRVKLQFHWEQFAPASGDKALQRCWVRVAQGWAGKRWGSLFLPRVGQEVIVEFMDGDPDQPIVTGSVYNAANMPPYPLPAKATISTIKSNSSKGGGGFNELRFDDAKGKEQLFIHAEKDWDSYIKHDALTWVGRDQHLVVEGKRFTKVGGAMHTLVAGDHNQQVDGGVSLQTGKDLLQKVGMNFAVDSGMAVHIKAGTSLVIEAGASITLKAGGGSIVIGPASVSITGTPVLLNAGGGGGAGAGCAPTAPTEPLKADDGSKALN